MIKLAEVLAETPLAELEGSYGKELRGLVQQYRVLKQMRESELGGSGVEKQMRK